MTRLMLLLLILVVATMLAFNCNAHAQTRGERSKLLTEVRTISLNGVEVRIDHFGLDAKGKRLFVAALGNNTVEVIDLVTGEVTRHIENLKAPQGVGFSPDFNRLAVANAQD